MISSRSLKFARALAEVAAEEEQAEAVEAGLEEFHGLYEENGELREVLESPAFPLTAKQEIVREISEKAGIAGIVANFLCLLLERSWIEALAEIREAYQQVLDERAGVVPVEVTSARPLDEAVKQRLRKAMAEVTKSQVKLSFDVKEELIGGLKVQVGSTVYDGTIQTELNELRRRLAVEA